MEREDKIFWGSVLGTLVIIIGGAWAGTNLAGYHIEKSRYEKIEQRSGREYAMNEARSHVDSRDRDPLGGIVDFGFYKGAEGYLADVRKQEASRQNP